MFKRVITQLNGLYCEWTGMTGILNMVYKSFASLLASPAAAFASVAAFSSPFLVLLLAFPAAAFASVAFPCSSW